MKILFFGDSITDMGRNRGECDDIWTYGSGYPFLVASALYRQDPTKFQVINRGIAGNRIVDLYARVKADVWHEQPDILSVLVGVNDIWHEFDWQNGVEQDRFERMYEMLIDDTLRRLPNVKMILCEPFVLKASATAEKFEQFKQVYDYAKIVKRLAEKHNLYFLPLQEKFNRAADKFGAEYYLYDGVHPNVAGATLIADAWLQLFESKILGK